MTIVKVGKLVFSTVASSQRTAQEDNLLAVFRSLTSSFADGEYDHYHVLGVLFRVEGFFYDEVKNKGMKYTVKIKRRVVGKIEVQGGYHKGGAYYEPAKIKII